MSKAEHIFGARVWTAERHQVEWSASDLDSLIGQEHRARTLWSLIDRLDLTAFYRPIQSREGEVGRPATDPKILLALWVYATSMGVGSAREVDRLCKTDAAYRWICGGVAMNPHTLSDFRVDHGDAVDGLMTQVIATLMHQGLLHLRRVAHDGMRVRASAGAASFRRKESLERCAQEAAEQIEQLRREMEEQPAATEARHRAARKRALEERSRAIERALEEMPKVELAKERGARKSKKKGSGGAKADDEKKAPRASTTDATARVMKMPDGGFRPAYNVQIATDTESRFIVGVDVSNAGSDHRLMAPMLDDIERRTGQLPSEHLVDGGFCTLQQIDLASERNVIVYAPAPKPRAHNPRRGRHDTPHVAAWRARMAQPSAAEIYKLRAATAETVNADLRRWRGLDRFVVRGLKKARIVATLSALTYNLLRWSGFAA
jgi:transposase